jgi:hypothetical protein
MDTYLALVSTQHNNLAHLNPVSHVPVNHGAILFLTSNTSLDDLELHVANRWAILTELDKKLVLSPAFPLQRKTADSAAITSEEYRRVLINGTFYSFMYMYPRFVRYLQSA